jgi:hypothetical protein
MSTAAKVSRTDIFGADDSTFCPINLEHDSNVMFQGFVGRRYAPGGTVLMAINPGGGGDAYARRTAEDEVFFPLLEALRGANPDDSLHQLDALSAAFPAIVRGWNLWRILGPTIDAAGSSLDEIAYLNCVPYRTRGDRMPRVSAQRAAWELTTQPILESLQPRLILALGKKAGGVLLRFYSGSADRFCIPRTVGDTYLSAEALEVLTAVKQMVGSGRGHLLERRP